MPHNISTLLWLTDEAGIPWTGSVANKHYACCLIPNAPLLNAAGNCARTQKPHQATLVPSMSLPAGSDTVAALYRFLFHLSLMVFVRYVVSNKDIALHELYRLLHTLFPMCMTHRRCTVH